jgi:hypothetical protein
LEVYLDAGFAIEFAVADAAEEGIPLGGSEVEDPASGVLAVADSDRIIRKTSDLYAIGVVRAE